MPKFVTAAVPGLLGGLGLLMDRPASPSTPLTDPLASGYMVEAGVAFPETAVRAALPAGLEPAPGATGGIAIYGGGEGARVSQHATANALDVAAFRLADGRTVSIARDWRGGDSKAQFLRRVRDGACHTFNGVLGPDYNSAHRDHLHLDRGPYRVCR